MISEGLPPGLRMGNDVKEMIVECCNEFIQCVSSEANEISTKENKTTILPEHVVAALESLDFASMIETVKATMNELKEEDKEVRAEKKKKKGMQISDEEALRVAAGDVRRVQRRGTTRRCDDWSWAASCSRQYGIIRLAK